MRSKTDYFRVLSGQFKGAKLRSPASSQTHPMGAREKLALFNRLAPYLSAAKVLDAYAGSGALGIEAISRGAAEAVFVEQASSVAQVISQNLRQLNLSAEVFVEPVKKFALRSEYQTFFNIVIADPPYDKFDMAEIVQLAAVLAPGGILALSYPARLSTPEFSGLELLSDRKYAGAKIALYQKL